MDIALETLVSRLGEDARAASRELVRLTDSARSGALRVIASAIRQRSPELLQANAEDISAATGAGLAAPLIERLKLSDRRIQAMAESVEQIAAQVDPVGQTLEGFVRPNGLRIEKRRVPLGVILFFYESRPNVTTDAAALCIKSGNAVILRGGKESIQSNRALAAIVGEALSAAGLPRAAVQLVDTPDRAIVPLLLKLDQQIDLVIPRGGESLIRAVVSESTIPVLKHYTGNCHIYVHEDARDPARVRDVCVNAKTSYPGGAVCNAVEHILFHRSVAAALVPAVCEALVARGVEIRADERARACFPSAAEATESDWSTEYLSLAVGVKVVDSLVEAIDHINRYGSHHTDAILSDSRQAIEQFIRDVDSGSVMVNASTRFADGGEYGLGAELGISTDKLHARGPMGAADLTTYKWIVTGDGHVRP